MSAEALVTIDALSKTFDVSAPWLDRMLERLPRQLLHAVTDVTFAINKGETFALVGESGSGKSTIAKIVVGLIPANGGAITIDGVTIGSTGDSRELRALRRRMQMIFQDPYGSLNPRKTVGAAIGEPIRVHGLGHGSEVEDKVAFLLERVGLPADHAVRFPHEFSGGQRQRLCIARTLGLDPKLIVADESVSALDASIKAQVINLMLDLQRELGLAYVFISHDIAVVERISHRIAVMLLGEIVEIGPRSEVLANPRHPYTQKLIAAVPVPDPDRKGIRRGLSTDEISSTVRSLDWQPPQRRMVEVGPDHYVMDG